MALTHDQVRLFRHNGYLKLDGRLPSAMEDSLKEAIWRDMRGEAEPVVRDLRERVVRLSQILNRDPIFRQAAAHPPLLDALESLLGPNIEIVKNRHNHATLNLAQPDQPDEVGIHRDCVEWSRSLISVLFYLEETTLDNGCTLIVPGTHLLPGIEVLHNVHEEDWIEASGILQQAVPVPMPAGGILAIDGLIFHRIGVNTTDSTRMSMTIGYHSADELSDLEDPKRRLVRGERRYRGNDRKSTTSEHPSIGWP